MATAKRRKITLKSIRKRTELPPIQCKQCKVWFIPKDRRYKFDKDSCRDAWNEEHYWKKEITLKHCKYCKRPFDTTKPVLQDYCNEDCRVAAAKERRDAEAAKYKSWLSTQPGEAQTEESGDDVHGGVPQ